MIQFDRVIKHFPGASRPAVDGVELTVPEGTTCVLLGPSGCGKSTTLRMVNRLVEPDAGCVLVNGENVAGLEPVRLRRGIGYVLQGVGLFPHRSVAQNVATVPALLGWPRRRISDRVDAMLELVGLDPREYRDRHPDELSGGQRQRVGVARALAADPPILLMDEPFGAVDPVARGRLQQEIGAILAQLRKTVILVTHDLAEGLLMGDRIVLMRDGAVVQSDSPERFLAKPADAFVSDFIGKDRVLRRLGLIAARTIAVAGIDGSGERLAADASLKDALETMLASGLDRLVLDGDDFQRVVTLDAVRAAIRQEPLTQNAEPSDRA